MMNDRRRKDRAERDVRALREALHVYLTGQAGIRFESLARFAGPLFDLYDLDWRVSDRKGDARGREELATMVAVLDTARLLWSYFSLDEESSLQMLPELEDALLGRYAGDEDRSNVLVLLSLLEEHWQQLSPSERAYAEDTPGFALPPFETLLSDYNEGLRSSRHDEDDLFGPDKLDLPEAIALFAQPLLESAEPEDDPDAFEARIARAHAYWELAKTPPDEYEAALARVLDTFASDQQERNALRAEAGRMLDRYHALFPEQAPGDTRDF